MKLRILGIIGFGDLGQHIAHYAFSLQAYSKIIFFDDFSEIGMSSEYGTVKGRIDDIGYSIENNIITDLLIGIGYNHFSFRKELFETYASKVNFPNIIHPSCYIDKSSIFGQGNVILPNCIIDKGCEIGSNLFFNPSCTIAHDNSIKSHSFFGPKVTTSGFVTIDECCFLGTGSLIKDKIHISKNVKLGIGSLVTKNIANSGTYYGFPVSKID